MTRCTIVIVAVALAAAGGCVTAGAKTPTDGMYPVEMPEVPEAMVQMRRRGCAGNRCPVYSVSLFVDGTVIYDGRANVAVVGQRRTTIPVERVSQLISDIDKTNFMDCPETCCLCPDGTPSELVVLDYRPGGPVKTIIHDNQCPSAAPSVRELEQAVDRAADDERWISPVPPNAGRPPGQ